MGIWRTLFTGQRDPVISAATDPVTFAVDADAIDPAVFGLATYVTPTAPAPRISRREAIQVPAVKRARDIIAGTIGGLPIETLGPDNRVAPSNAGLSLLTQPERDVPRSVTMVRTVEDLLLEGVAFWRIVTFGWHGYPTRVVRLDPRSVDLRPDGRVYYRRDGSPQGTAQEWIPDAEIIRFDSPSDALLVAGARAIRTALTLDAAAARFAEGVPPLDYFAPADDVDLDEDDVTEVLNAWQTARQTRATGYVPSALKYETAGFNPEQLQMADARDHAVREIARLAGIDPEDLGVSTTSRTYFNAFDRRQDRIQATLGPFLRAFEDRLSMGDVTPRGYRCKFNLGDLLRSDDKSRWEAYGVGLAVGAITPEQIAEREGNPTVNTPAPKPVPAAPQIEATALVEEQTFSDAETVTFDAPSAPEVFAVNREKRTITGLAVPYGVISNDGRKYAFAKGSITYADPSRIKLLVGHNWDRAIGHATALDDTDDGLMATFKVARGAAGDEALSMAEDGVWDGLSVGIGRGMTTRLDSESGIQHVTSAPLREISQTPCPAYDGARITEVAASMEGTDMPETETEPVAAPIDFTALGDQLTGAITEGFAGLQFPQRETVSANGGSVTVSEPSPYRFDGTEGAQSFSEDLRAYQSDPEARQRLDVFMEEAFAVTTTNTGSLNPTQNRPDLFVPNLTFTRPLWNMVSTGTVDSKTPFTIPKFASATGLVNAHTEGVEPTPGAFTATSQTVSPTPVSGKVEIVREVWDQGGSPQADQIIWGEMLNAYFEAIEARIASLLNGLAITEINLASATDAALVNSVSNIFVDLQFVRGGNRYSALALDGMLFKALIGAADSTGRKLLPVVGATNAQGGVTGNFSSVQIGSQTGSAAWALGSTVASNSYLFVPSSVWCWASAPKKFLFEYRVSAVDLAIWGYTGAAVLRDSDVKRIDYTTADS